MPGFRSNVRTSRKVKSNSVLPPGSCYLSSDRNNLYGRIRAVRPCSQHLAKHHQLSNVVGVMIGHEERFAQNGLTFTMRNAGKQIGRWVCYQPLHGVQVRLKGPNTLIPRRPVRWLLFFGPIAVWELRRDVVRVPTEL